LLKLPELDSFAKLAMQRDDQGLADLKAWMNDFQTSKPKSEFYQIKFGDKTSVSSELMNCASKFQPLSTQEQKLQEFNSWYLSSPGNCRQGTVQLFQKIAHEFFKHSDRNEGKARCVV
jgi:hypothetical protein